MACRPNAPEEGCRHELCTLEDPCRLRAHETSHRAPSAHHACRDTRDWTNEVITGRSRGRSADALTCDDYVRNGYCFQTELLRDEMGGSRNNWPERNCCDCGKAEHLGLPSTIGLQCLVYHITADNVHRLSAEPCDSPGASDWTNLGGSPEQKFPVWAIVDGLVKPVDPHKGTYANDDYCLDADLQLVQCHDLEPFYPTHPYHSQTFMCFDNVEHHEEGAVCVAPVDVTEKHVGAAAHGRVAAVEEAFWPVEAARRDVSLIKADMDARLMLPEAAEGLPRGPSNAAMAAVAAGALLLGAVAVAAATAARRRLAAAAATVPAEAAESPKDAHGQML